MVKMFAKTMIKDSTIIKARTTTEAVSDMTPFLSLLSSVLSVTKKKKKMKKMKKIAVNMEFHFAFLTDLYR